jgi:hypothetical protein
LSLWTRMARSPKAPGHEGPPKESNDSHQLTKATPKDSSSGRDSRFGLARPVLVRIQKGGIEPSWLGARQKPAQNRP